LHVAKCVRNPLEACVHGICFACHCTFPKSRAYYGYQHDTVW
jgi:hypothetical protein